MQAFFASTWGPIAWVITGEIFPLQVRAKAMSLSVVSVPFIVRHLYTFTDSCHTKQASNCSYRLLRPFCP